jgi:REP element-mobilizing transposase RayT
MSESTQLGGEGDALLGVEAKTGLYPVARSWRGGRRRIRGLGIYESDCFHVMSRTCGGAVFFDEVEKEALRRVLRRMAEFCGVEVLTYCVMGNHFHALVSVPHRPSWMRRFEGPDGEKRLLAHLRVLYSKDYIAQLMAEMAEWRRLGLEGLVTAKLEGFKRRMCDLSRFVKEVKERFGRWYNKRHERKGTLWMERFKSVLVEGSRGQVSSVKHELNALQVMAAYIDLNPVRAELVDEPGTYAWSGFGEAERGSKRARRGLWRVVRRGPEVSAGSKADAESWWKEEGREAYRQMLMAAHQPLQVGNRVFSRYSLKSEALGTKGFVESVFEANRDLFPPNRREGARKVRCMDEALFALRQLRAGEAQSALPNPQ